ncbi:restin homolog [Sesamum indicum]|uniref:Restin homolog n=1 Tax=Sesamum indicum TaxID=4182 RepID=A0A6I9UPP1_SESIN|nr:restin homolog [Sesamum indicum]
MIREKIFRVHRRKPSSVGTDASAHKFDFTFSKIQALQVPKGWDKLYISLISSESAKTIRKSGKGSVKNGTCQWTEILSESICTSDVGGDYHLKFVVSTGSSKSGILGETTLNLAAFLSSESPTLVSLPLKKCSYGTSLQVEVRCLTPQTNLRDEKWKETNAHKDETTDNDDMENRSEVSDSTVTKSTESYSGSNFGNSSRPRELGSRETSFSASVSRYSFDSMDDSIGRQSFSSQSERNGPNNVFGRQDSIESNDSSSYCSYSPHGPIRSVRSLQGPLARENQSNNQREELRRLSHAAASLLQQHGSSSKMFKEDYDAIVQELEAEARMWEQNARKMAVDMESLRKELSDQKLSMTKLNTELANSQSESRKLTEEIKHLKSLLEESAEKQKVDQETETSSIQKELEDEMRLLKEANENLSIQLKKTQESNFELITILQEMEETMEKQKLEIKSLSEMSKADSHEEVPQENNSSSLEIELVNSQELKRALQSEILVLESKLEDKVIETEIEQDLKNQILKGCLADSSRRLAAKEQEIMNLESTLSRALSDEPREVYEHGSLVDASGEIEKLKGKVRELETDCNELTEENLELLLVLKELRKNVSEDSIVRPISSCDDISAKGKNKELKSQISIVKDCNLDLDLQKSNEEQEENESEIVELQKQLVSEPGSNDGGILENVFKSGTIRDVDEMFPALLMQLQSFLGSIKKESDLSLLHANGSKDAICDMYGLESIHSFQTARVKDVLNRIVLLLDTTLTEYENNFQNIEEDARREGESNACEGQSRKASVSLEESTLEPGMSSKDELDSSDESTCDCMVVEPNADTLRNEKEIEAQSYPKSSMKLQNNMEIIDRDGTVTSDCSHNSISDMILLNSSKISHLSHNKVDRITFMEPENNQTEWGKHLTELEEENIYLSQRVSGLEAQLRYLTDTRELSRLEFQHSESQVVVLQNQIRRLEEEIESQKLNMKHKLLEMEKRWSEAQEECTSLSKLNIRLQTTTESLIEEYNSLQKFNGELREQKLKLQNQCMVLEAEARKIQDSCCSCAENMGTLEVKYSLLTDEITAKGKIPNAELDCFNIPEEEHEDKLLKEKYLLNKTYMEKAKDAANLELKVAYVSGQVSTYVEKEPRSLVAVAKKHYGYLDKSKLEMSIDGVQQDDLEGSERENKVVLAGNQEKLQKLFNNIMHDESKRKSVIDELESRIGLSELERFRLEEENSVLHRQLQIVPELQNEVLSLRVSLKEMKFQNQLLEASLESVSGDYEELKHERVSMVQSISSMQKEVSEAEDSIRKKNALEEKILRLEGDLVAKDALSVQDAEMKNELNQIKMANRQLLMKVKHLEDVREDLQRMVQALEEELNQTRCHGANMIQQSKLPKGEEDTVVAVGQRKLSIDPHQSHKYLNIQDNIGITVHQVQAFSERDRCFRRSRVPEMDYESRLKLLEDELVKALDSRDMYKSQLESVLAVASIKSEPKETTGTSNTENKISLLEAELQEIRERYLQISLKYAEVEAQREQLVMKLKALNR